jgi:hypothetical protein
MNGLAGALLLVRLWCLASPEWDNQPWNTLYESPAACEAARRQVRLKPSKKFPAGEIVDAQNRCVCKGELPLGMAGGRDDAY